MIPDLNLSLSTHDINKPGVGTSICNPSSGEAESGRSLGRDCHPVDKL